jgi:hypothetical protein
LGEKTVENCDNKYKEENTIKPIMIPLKSNLMKGLEKIKQNKNIKTLNKKPLAIKIQENM